MRRHGHHARDQKKLDTLKKKLHTDDECMSVCPSVCLSVTLSVFLLYTIYLQFALDCDLQVCPFSQLHVITINECQ